MEKRSYITVLSNDEYLDGALILAESLKKTGTQYPLTVLITDDVSNRAQEILEKFNLNIIRKNKIEVPPAIKEKNYNGMFPHWNNTFDKLLIFELTDFDKLVYLDSDMYIRNNIDNLFERKNMSATIDRRYKPTINKDWIKLTSRNICSRT